MTYNLDQGLYSSSAVGVYKDYFDAIWASPALKLSVYIGFQSKKRLTIGQLSALK